MRALCGRGTFWGVGWGGLGWGAKEGQPTMETVSAGQRIVGGNIMWVKICGIRDVEPPNGWRGWRPMQSVSISTRRVRVAYRRSRPPRLSAACRTMSSPVGLFVNHPLLRFAAFANTLDCGACRLHGDETPEFLAELKGVEIIRAFARRGRGTGRCPSHLDRCRELGVRLRACLLDAQVAGSYGGTGQTARGSESRPNTAATSIRR